MWQSKWSMVKIFERMSFFGHYIGIVGWSILVFCIVLSLQRNEMRMLGTRKWIVKKCIRPISWSSLKKPRQFFPRQNWNSLKWVPLDCILTNIKLSKLNRSQHFKKNNQNNPFNSLIVWGPNESSDLSNIVTTVMCLKMQSGILRTNKFVTYWMK
jgi:hypothetical protein